MADMWNGRHLKHQKIRDKCMVVRVDWLPYICLLFSGFSNVCHFTCIWPRALKLGCITNVDMLFLTMGFICFFYVNKLMLISGGHISNRSMTELVDNLNYANYELKATIFNWVCKGDRATTQTRNVRGLACVQASMWQLYEAYYNS